MMGTKTSNFSDEVASETQHETQHESKTTNKEGESSAWQTFRKTPLDFIRKSSVEEVDDLRESSSNSANILKNTVTSNPLKTIWSRRTAAKDANQPCIVELRCAKNLPVMGSDDDGTNPFVTMKVIKPLSLSL